MSSNWIANLVEYQLDWMKIADFLSIAHFCASPILYCSYLSSSSVDNFVSKSSICSSAGLKKEKKSTLDEKIICVKLIFFNRTAHPITAF